MSLNQQTIQRKGKQTLWLDGDIERPVSELAGSSLFLSDTALISPAALGHLALGCTRPLA
jgi:branched-subunit amino acid aminotransferase/4-amino-4-deoxychorismate lyase